MAVTLPNHHSLSFSPNFPSFTKPSKTLNSPTLQLTQCLSKSNLGFPISSSFPPVARLSFKCKSKRSDGEEGGRAGQKNMPNVKTLIPIYKEAILEVDEETVSDIEKMIYIIEKEKYELTQKVAVLSADIASRKDEYIHLQADFENFRKRFEKDRVRMTSNAQTYVIESLLPMVDAFEKTKQQTRPETEKEKKIVTSYQGIYKQFVETMRSLRVAVIGTVGKPFDPSLHEAIGREESQEYKEGIIIQEVSRGFLLGDQVLRPAKVKVSAGPGRQKARNITEESNVQGIAAVGLDESSLPSR